MMPASCAESFSKKTGFASRCSLMWDRMACSMIEARALSWGSEATLRSKSRSSTDTGFMSSRTLASIRRSMSLLTLAPIAVQSAPASSRRYCARTYERILVMRAKRSM